MGRLPSIMYPCKRVPRETMFRIKVLAWQRFFSVEAAGISVFPYFKPIPEDTGIFRIFLIAFLKNIVDQHLRNLPPRLLGRQA